MKRTGWIAILFLSLLLSGCGQPVRLAGPPERLRITTVTLPYAVKGEPYSVQLGAEGGEGSYTWTVVPGSSLPKGLYLSTSGILSGTPVYTGAVEFEVQCSAN